MKTLKKIGVLVAAILLVPAGIQAAPTGGGPSVNQVLILDNFDSGSDRNSVGGTTQGDEEYPGGCLPAFASASTDVFGGQGKSLKLDYDVTVPNSFSYYWSKTGQSDIEPGSSTPLDMRSYHYFSFWIKTKEEAPRFGIEFHRDDDGNKFFVLGKDTVSKVPATRFVMGENTDQWRKVVIPFTSFRQFKDWNNIMELVFVFENKNRSKKGVLYVDDILFGSADPSGETAAAPIETKEVFGYFKINGAEVDGKTVSLGQQNDLELFLKNIPSNLERILFEVSYDEGQTWNSLKTFYEHRPGESYKYQWMFDKAKKPGLLRASVSNIHGVTTAAAGPFKLKG